jgi:alkanesulfonate monooxygenase SsuD/methylene tetrahydromethanopterin reductase-like flavin-dependent oxidoreductase (luciferase family)
MYSLCHLTLSYRVRTFSARWEETMTRHPWVAQADNGVRFGVQIPAVHHSSSDFWESEPFDDPMAALLDAGRLVEDLGFDGVFIYDHPLVHPDPWVVLAGLAMITERVMLGSVVMCAPYRHPTFFARLSTDLDHLSHGRFLLGLGIGWGESEFRALGVPFAPVRQRQAALDEAVEIIRELWTGEPISYAGAHYHLDHVRIVPQPRQQPAPPIMIGGNGLTGTLRQVARYADACNIFEDEGLITDLHDTSNGLMFLRKRLDALQRHCEAIGRPHDEIMRSYCGWFILAQTEAEVRAKLQRSRAATVAAGGPIAGTPAQLVEFFQQRIAIGIQYFVMILWDANDHETLHLMASEVIPHLQ